MKQSLIELTDAEWTVIKKVWDLEPCTAPTVQKELHGETGWTYSTVRTIMDRMIVKGLLAGEKPGKMTVYRSIATRGRAQEGELLSVLRNAFSGALTPMVQCLLNSNELSERELSEIETLIKAKKRKTKEPE
ncbi:MAG TPA: BlaI/MecI/CopY family transcriptional regulator [Verrucomicrobiales bacterium]|jgi:predicted transcriptional regulator|nr:BlaI/MecI/CopY family transcriptional regulator [Verrucomicrobiales bacterium]HIL71224.1 BlaI/MecI/CopY family transcriptional regulator [Verrucomicrobiota bacterium]